MFIPLLEGGERTVIPPQERELNAWDSAYGPGRDCIPHSHRGMSVRSHGAAGPGVRTIPLSQGDQGVWARAPARYTVRCGRRRVDAEGASSGRGERGQGMGRRLVAVAVGVRWCSGSAPARGRGSAADRRGDRGDRSVQLGRDGAWQPAAAKLPLFEGQTIRTGEGRASSPLRGGLPATVAGTARSRWRTCCSRRSSRKRARRSPRRRTRRRPSCRSRP